MDENFKRLKKKYMLGAIIKSVLCGITAGLAAAGAMLLGFKLGGINISVLYYVLAGAGAAALAGGLVFLLIMPTDKKVARSLDERYGLNERAQTALAFGGESGTIVEMQRADTYSRLSGISVPAVSFGGIWKPLVAFVLSAGIAVAGIAVPGRILPADGDIPEENRPAEVTDAQRIRLEQLISDVNRSNLAAELKAPVIDGLEELDEKLGGQLTNGQLRSAVEEVRTISRETMAGAATYTAVAGCYSGGDYADVKSFAEAISGGGDAYLYYDALSYDDTVSFYNDKMYDGVDTGLKVKYNLFRAEFIPDDGSGEEGETVKTEAELLGSALTTILIVNSLLTTGLNSDEDAATSALGGLVADFAARLVTDATNPADMTALQNRLDDSFGIYKIYFINELSVQSYNLLMGRFVRNALVQIFPGLGFELELAASRPADGGTGGIGGGGDDNDPSGSGGGGSGSGDMTYGSADEIYDPFTGTYRKYGDVLGEYYAIVRQYLDGGELTDEQMAAVELYFDILYGTPAGNS